MKKTLLFFGVSLMISSVNAQTYFADDFEGGSLTANNAWNVKVVANPDALPNTWVLGVTAGNYAKASGFNGTNHVTDWWLISPQINLTLATTPNLEFDMTKRFAGDDIKVKVSTNYDGSSAPATATWADITSLFTLDANTGSWNFVNSGQGDLTTYAGGNMYLAFQYTSTSSEASTWEIDNIQLIEGSVTPPSTQTIASVQETSGGDQSNLVGTQVTIGGRVSGIKETKGFFIQDNAGAWNGIYVYDFGANTVALGDSVIVSGTVAEFTLDGGTTNATQISNLTNFTFKGANTPYPATVLTTAAANAEMYESVLVSIQTAVCSAAMDGFFEYSVNDGSGNLQIDDFMYLTTPSPLVGNIYNITGISGHNFSAFKLQPRSSSDVVLVTGVGINDISNERISAYPNPSNGVLNIKNYTGQSPIKVYNLVGELVLTTSEPTFNLDKGVYIIHIGHMTQKVLVK